MDAFQKEIKNFQGQIELWQQEHLAWADRIVFNKDLLNLKAEEVRYILVGDNPGKEEQKAHRYLIGTAGQGARRFFEETAQLVESFDREVMVLNKTPVFTPSTMDLAELGEIARLLEESQMYMAGLICRLQKICDCPVWVTGFGGCRSAQGEWKWTPAKTRPLACFFRTLKAEGAPENEEESMIYFFKHFSYSHFQKDAHFEGKPDTPEEYREKLLKIGAFYRQGFW